MTTLLGVFRAYIIFIYKKEVKNEKGEVVQIKLECEKQYKDLIDSTDGFYAMCYADNHKTLCLITGRGTLILFRPESLEQSKRCLYGKIKFGM